MIHTSTLGYAGILLLVLGVGLLCLLVSRTGSPVARWLGRERVRLDRDLRRLHAPVSAGQVAAAIAVGIVLSVAAGTWLDRWFFGGTALAVGAPYLLIAYGRRRRIKVIEEQLPSWLTALANFLKVSGSIADSLRQTADMSRGPLKQELELVLKELKLGNPLPEALKQMVLRVGSPILSAVVTIILIGRRTGGELPGVLEETAGSLRERMRLEGVLRKQTAMGRSQMVILFVSPPIIVFLFEKADPGFFRPLLEGGFLGQMVICAAALMWLGALFSARKILAVEL